MHALDEINPGAVGEIQLGDDEIRWFGRKDVQGLSR